MQSAFQLINENDAPAQRCAVATMVGTLSAHHLGCLGVPDAALGPGRALPAMRMTNQVLTQLRPVASNTESLALRADGLEVSMGAFASAIDRPAPSTCDGHWLARWAWCLHLPCCCPLIAGSLVLPMTLLWILLQNFRPSLNLLLILLQGESARV